MTSMSDTASASPMAVTPLRAGALLDARAAGTPARLDLGQVLRAYQTYGAVLLRGLDLDRRGFKDFTERFLDRFMDYVGGADNDRSSAYGDDNTVLTVTGGAVAKLAVPLHGEMFYTQPRPATLFFCCITPAAERGETTLCDGVALWNALPAAIQERFDAQKIQYRRIYDRDTWHKVYRTDDLAQVEQRCADAGLGLRARDDGGIEVTHVCHAWLPTTAGKAFVNSILPWAAREYVAGMADSEVRFEDGSELPVDMLYEIHGIADELTQNVDWQPGDVALVDNRRFMHGRRAYDDLRRDIIMRLGAAPLEGAAGG